MAPPVPCVLGFAPHSGWSAVVMVGGSRAAPVVLVRERIELAEPTLAGAKQPYHALADMPLPQARAQLARFEASADSLALAALRALLARAQQAGATAHGAGILHGSGRAGATLEATLASHALIHTADGNHFRAALARGCEALGLTVTRVAQRALLADSSAALQRSPAALATTVNALGRELGAPWGADQKAAALLGWMLLPA